MKARQSGYSQTASAAKAGFSERTGRKIEKGEHYSKEKGMRHWRTRIDPFESVWDSELVPMLKAEPRLTPTTLLEYLEARYPEQYSERQLRSLQRRIRNWRALEGPEQEVMFRQEHVPGRLSLSDFTKLKGITILISGEAFNHLLYHFRLAYSGWSYMRVIVGGESFTALTEGLQEALWRLGGVPLEHRTDHLSAAFKNRHAEQADDQTAGYKAFCEHYCIKATRNNLGQKHENGAVESPHGHLKRRIEQALLLRGHNEFENVEAYQAWLEGVVEQYNRRHAKQIELERKHLQALPTQTTRDYTELCVKVTTSSTITVRTSLYTVPSRLIGRNLKIRLFDQRLECYLGNYHVTTLKRVYGIAPKRRARQIDYRHVIDSLIKKPQAFRGSALRDDLLPNETYRTIWKAANEQLCAEKACRFIVGLLHLAYHEDCQEALGSDVLDAIANKRRLILHQFEQRYRRSNLSSSICPEIATSQHELNGYDDFIPESKLKHADTKEICHA